MPLNYYAVNAAKQFSIDNNGLNFDVFLRISWFKGSKMFQ